MGAVTIFGAGNSIIQESFSEQWTGRYDPDGHKIYRQAFLIPDMPSAGGSQNIPLGFTIGTHFMLVGGWVANVNGSFYPLPYTNNTNVIYQVALEVSATKDSISLAYGSGFDGDGGAFHLEYTKA